MELAGAEFGAGIDLAAENFGHLERSESVIFPKISAEVGEDLGRGDRADGATEGVRKGKGMAGSLQAGKNLGQGFSWAEECADEIPELTEGEVEGDGDEFDGFVGGGGIGGRGDFGREGKLVKGAVGAVVAEFGLKVGGGALGGEEPLSGTGRDMNLVDPLFPWDENLEIDFSVRGLLSCLTQLVSGKVPVGEEGLGISGGEEEAAGAVTFGKLAEGFELWNVGGDRLGEEGGKSEGVGVRADGERGFSEAGESGFFQGWARGNFFGFRRGRSAVWLGDGFRDRGFLFVWR